MGLFSRRKRRHSSDIAGQRERAPGTEITFDPRLIERFKGHHRTLLKLFEDIDNAAGQYDFNKLADLLGRFKRVLQEHLLEENLKLYTYMQACMRNDPDNAEIMRDMKAEMGRIGRDVNRFIGTWTHQVIDASNIQDFQRELKGIGEVLADRIEREEHTLYPLYMRPEQYA